MQSELTSLAQSKAADVSKGDELTDQKEIAGDNLLFEVMFTPSDKSFKILSEKSTMTTSEDDKEDNLELANTESSLSCIDEKELFTYITTLGSGSYGKVFLVQKNIGPDKGKYYAMKVIKKANLMTRNQLVKNVVNEINVL